MEGDQSVVFFEEVAREASSTQTGKLEVLGVYPPRTEAPIVDKLALCYAPHVDMTTVIEVEVRKKKKSNTRGENNYRKKERVKRKGTKN